MLNEIETVEWYFGNSLKAKEVAPAWGRIKKFVEVRTAQSGEAPSAQLKAEIAALIADIGEPNGNTRYGIDIRQIIERLRQLSAF